MRGYESLARTDWVLLTQEWARNSEIVGWLLLSNDAVKSSERAGLALRGAVALAHVSLSRVLSRNPLAKMYRFRITRRVRPLAEAPTIAQTPP